MLEDDFNDVLTKAIRGTNFDTSSLNLDKTKLDRCLAGEFDSEIITALSSPLGLDTQKLLLHSTYSPDVVLPAEVHTFTSPFGHLGVNAFAIEGDEHILIFDTGTDAHSCINFLAIHPDKEKHLFITHPHADHTGCKNSLISYVKDCQLLEPNKKLQFKNLTLSTIDVAGHHPQAVAYLVEGLETPICILGDAIFAGSIGGIVPSLYEQGITNIRKNILSLKPKTLILNGHGPSTSVGLEIQNNPFF